MHSLSSSILPSHRGALRKSQEGYQKQQYQNFSCDADSNSIGPTILTPASSQISVITDRVRYSDSRIPALIRNGVQEKKRSFFVVVGDRSKDVIVHLHYIMSSMDMKQNKSVLWAYKNKLLGFTRSELAHVLKPTQADIEAVTGRNVRAKSRRKLKEAYEKPIPKTPSNFSFPSITFVMYTTRRQTRYLEIPMGCAYCKTSKPSHQIYLPGLLRR